MQKQMSSFNEKGKVVELGTKSNTTSFHRAKSALEM